ncbi:MAG: cysteine peptidase family C39 domain-containing protein, partial [Burkholderiales bacterium]
MFSLLNRNRLKTPTLLQMEAVECGAAALGIVLRYFGAWPPLEEIRVQCGVGRDGVNARNIIQAARHYGLVAKGFKKNLEDLKTLAKPAILFWNFNHFLVLEGIAGDKVYLNDPASGPRVVSLQELDESFTGVVLTFAVGENFKRGKAPAGLLGQLSKRLRGSESALGFALTAGLLLVIPGMAIPAFSAVFVDQILVAQLNFWIYPLLLGMAITAVLRGALTWLREFCLLRLETHLSVASSSAFLRHILQLPMQFFAQRYAGEIGSRVALNDQVAKLLSGRLAATAIDLVMVQFYLLLMFFYDWALALIGLGAALVNATVLKLVARKREDGNRRA